MASGLMMLGTVNCPLGRLLAVNAGTIAGLDDAALWERFAIDRDEAAFAALVERHGAMVLQTSRRILGYHPSAEDAFQTTFVILARRGGSIRRFATLGPWLHRVAVREADRIRSRARRLVDQNRAASSIGGDGADSHRAEVGAAVHVGLDRLPAVYRLPIVLCDLEGRTQASAAAHLGWTEETVRGRLDRGRARLQVQLTRQGYAPAVVPGGSIRGWGSTATATVGEPAAFETMTRLSPGLVARAVHAGVFAAASPWNAVAWLAEGSAASWRALSGAVSVRSVVVAVGLVGPIGLGGCWGWSHWERTQAAAALAASVAADETIKPMPRLGRPLGVPGPVIPPPAPAATPQLEAHVLEENLELACSPELD